MVTPTKIEEIIQEEELEQTQVHIHVSYLWSNLVIGFIQNDIQKHVTELAASISALQSPENHEKLKEMDAASINKLSETLQELGSQVLSLALSSTRLANSKL